MLCCCLRFTLAYSHDQLPSKKTETPLLGTSAESAAEVESELDKMKRDMGAAES